MFKIFHFILKLKILTSFIATLWEYPGVVNLRGSFGLSISTTYLENNNTAKNIFFNY